MTVNNVNIGQHEPTRVVLSEEQTAAVIEQAGTDRHEGRVFACIGPGSFPDSAGRLNLYLVPAVSVEAADAAIRVVRGLSREAKRRATAPANTGRR